MKKNKEIDMLGTIKIAMRDEQGNMTELDTKTMLELALFLSKREQQELSKKAEELRAVHGDHFVVKSFEKASKSQVLVTAMIEHVSKNSNHIAPSLLSATLLLRTAASEDIKNAHGFLKYNNL